MPAKWLECCGETFTLAEAIEHTRDRSNRCEWTPELLAGMVHAATAHPSNEDGTRISTTVLTSKCTRQLVYERQTDYVTTPGRLWPMFRGTMLHALCETHFQSPAYAEARFYVHDLGSKLPEVLDALPDYDRSLSGSPDLVEPHIGILYDYKSAKKVPQYSYPWKDHVAQLNINRWLIDNADEVAIAVPPQGSLVGTLTDDGRWLYDLSLDEVRSVFVPHDWQELVVVYFDNEQVKSLTATTSVSVPTKAGGTRRAREAEIWDDERVESYIAEHYIAARLALLDGSAPIPPGWEHQSHVLCGYCPVRRQCATDEFNEALAEALAALDNQQGR